MLPCWSSANNALYIYKYLNECTIKLVTKLLNMAEAVAASEDKRTINKKTVNAVLAFVPMDGFKLRDNLLNKKYTVVGVDERDFNKVKTFVAILEDDEGHIVNLSAAALKKARILGKKDIEGQKAFTGCENIFLRSEAEAIWNSSAYYHSKKMVKDKEFVLPTHIKLRYAVLSEDQMEDKPTPAMNPFNYQKYREVVNAYQKVDPDSFPSVTDFIEELEKSPEDGRLSFLPIAMKKPTPHTWCKDDVSEYRHTLIIEDIAD